jgi:hypothetical protein
VNQSLIVPEAVEKRILLIRGERVMIDADLAELYGVTTKALNQAVKRNQHRFPSDFMFRLTENEKQEVVTICDHLEGLKFSRSLPHAFTEHGAIMLATILNSRRAIEASIFVVRGFVRLRNLLASHKELAHKLNELEARISEHDADIQTIVRAIHQLMLPPERPRKQIGFRVEERKAVYKVRRKSSPRASVRM